MPVTIRARVLRGFPVILLAPARWLERAKGRRRKALAALYVLIIVSVGLLAWRESRLAFLPDIDDPFDPAPLRGLRVPDGRNAFALYRQAAKKARHNWGVELRIFNSPYAWPASDPEALEYLKANRESLELWRLGCERPEALYYPIDQIKFSTELKLYEEHRHFVRMALVVANRHRAEGDMAGAWLWYRAILLRGSRLIGRHAVAIGQLTGYTEYAATTGQVASWAADPRVDVDLLRRALEDVKAINALSAPASETVKIEYLSCMKELDNPEALAKFLLENEYSGLALEDKTYWCNHSPTYRFAERFLTHEPERSRRLLKLAFANILAHCDDPPERRPPLLSGGTRLANASPQLFDTPGPPGAPSAKTLATRLLATPLAHATYPTVLGSLAPIHDFDRAQRTSLIATLTTELDRRARARGQ